MKKKTVIIGGIAGGATTATRLRRLDEEMEIIIFEKGDYISYANCGLPYHIGDVIKDRETLLIQTPEKMKASYNVDVRTGHEVVAINPEDKTVRVLNLKTKEKFLESYDTLVISTGSSPLKPPIPGIDGPNIFSLWTVPDTDNIKAFISDHKPKRAAVIGGGFIGVEMAENLHALGINVSLIEMMDQVMAPLDFEMAQLIHENMVMNGVDLHLGDGVQSFETNDMVTKITLKSGTQVEADLVILSIGVRPNSRLAKEAGLKLNEGGGVIVDSQMRTSHPDIYAVGDVIEVENFVLKTPCMVPLAGPANKQARICANNIMGGKEAYEGTLGTAIAQVFDLTAASVGLNEKNLQALGKVKNKDYFVALIHQKSHATYYPGATPLDLKIIFDKEGKIFGNQVVGQDGVDKRIDVLASAMRLGATIYDLKSLELAYAPPFGSAKDPVNMLGFVGENILKGLVSFVECYELDEMVDKDKGGLVILDVGEDAERTTFEIPGSTHIPLSQLRERIDELDPKTPTVVYCAIGVRSYNGARILSGKGFENVRVLSGGSSFYKSMHYRDFVSYSQGVLDTQDIDYSGSAMEILNCTGLQCPGPIMKVNETINAMTDGEVLAVSATDMGFSRDVESWCRRTGNTFLKTERKDKQNIVYLRKGTGGEVKAMTTKQDVTMDNQGKTIIVFSGDLDKVLAAFIIANGAAAMGRPVTLFFTFWGLNALRKPENQNIKKPFIEKMFGAMMPQGSSNLKLSNMNMAGMGTKMMKMVMKDKNVNSLEELIQQAMGAGVKLIACTMSMDIMGITEDELIEGVELGGVATYLGEAEESNVNLFV